MYFLKIIKHNCSFSKIKNDTNKMIIINNYIFDLLNYYITNILKLKKIFK